MTTLARKALDNFGKTFLGDRYNSKRIEEELRKYVETVDTLEVPTEEKDFKHSILKDLATKYKVLPEDMYKRIKEEHEAIKKIIDPKNQDKNAKSLIASSLYAGVKWEILLAANEGLSRLYLYMNGLKPEETPSNYELMKIVSDAITPNFEKLINGELLSERQKQKADLETRASKSAPRKMSGRKKIGCAVLLLAGAYAGNLLTTYYATMSEINGKRVQPGYVELKDGSKLERALNQVTGFYLRPQDEVTTTSVPTRPVELNVKPYTATPTPTVTATPEKIPGQVKKEQPKREIKQKSKNQAPKAKNRRGDNEVAPDL